VDVQTRPGQPGVAEIWAGPPELADPLWYEEPANPPRQWFTLQVNFSALNEDAAPAVAAALMQALGALCPHVEPSSAVVAPADGLEHARPVFCAAPGPGDACCEDLYGHAGWHAEAGVRGLRWDAGGALR
jgi:hypothetical protein